MPESSTARLRLPRPRVAIRAGAAVSGFLLLCVAADAGAQTTSPLPEWEYSAGQLLRSYFMGDKLPTLAASVGVSAEVFPKFDGSSHYGVLGGPTFDIRYRDIAFLSTGEGLGVNILRGTHYRSGIALTYELGRSNNESVVLRGLGDVHAAPELKVFAEGLVFPVVIRADIRRALGGYNGWAADFAVYLPITGSKKFYMLVGPSIAFGDSSYMRHFFGITETESQTSGLPVYTPGAGIKSINFGTNATLFVTDHWFLNSVLAVDRLLGGAAGSPTTSERMQFATTFTVGYDF